jgi:hypothetical protein
MPGVRHCDVATHTTGFAPTQAPAMHASLWVHASPSLQGEPFGLMGSLHAPVDGLQTPASWQLDDAAQVTAVPPRQAPC